jgi:type II secretory pathway component PulM
MTLREWFNERPPRERLMLLAMIPTFLILGAFLTIFLISDALTEREDKIASMRETLALIQTNQTKFLRERDRKAALDAKLADRSFSPKTFLREQGTALGLSVNATDGNRKSAAVGTQTDLLEQEIDLNFTQIEYNDLAAFLDAISTTDAPLYVRNLTITRTSTGRRGVNPSAGQDDRTPLNVNLTIVTFRQDDSTAP